MGKCKFNQSWLSKVDVKGLKYGLWLRAEVKEDESKALCTVCDFKINVGKGFQAIAQHELKDKHASNIKVKLSAAQLHLTAVGSSTNCTSKTHEVGAPASSSALTLDLYSITEATFKAELIWCLKCVASNFSARFCDHIADVFCVMFPGDISRSFSMGRTKYGYFLQYALGPYFYRKMIEDIDQYFSLTYDETTNAEGLKELQVLIKYWSKMMCKVAVNHLQTFFIRSATSAVLKSHIFEAIDNSGLQLKNLVMVSSDGPNVNKAVFKLIDEEVKAVRPSGMLNVGTCNLHTVTNAFLKALAKLGINISDSIIAIAMQAFIYDFPSREQDFLACQASTKTPKHKLIRHMSSRWLTLESASKQVVEQLPALRQYFLEFIPEQKSQLTKIKKYKLICDYLKNPTYEAELYFVWTQLPYS